MVKNKKQALGRGLSSLLPEESSWEDNPSVFFCPLEAIRPSKLQPRIRVKEKNIQELAASIKEKGLLQPLLVREISPGIYELVAGERRWRAARIVGLDRVPVILKDLTAQEALELALIENLQREDLSPLEEARGYQKLIDEFGLTQQEIAKRMGKKRSTIANALRLLKLPSDIQEDLLEGKISAGHARALLSLDDPSLMRKIRDKIITQKLSVRETEKLIKKFLLPKKQIPSEKDPNLLKIERDLQKLLGTRVKFSWKKNKGKLTIEFRSEEELENFLSKLRG